MMRLIYEEMMIEKDVRNFILDMKKIEISGDSQKFLPYREISIIFCMPEISTICQKFLDQNCCNRIPHLFHIQCFSLRSTEIG